MTGSEAHIILCDTIYVCTRHFYRGIGNVNHMVKYAVHYARSRWSRFSLAVTFVSRLLSPLFRLQPFLAPRPPNRVG